jgi:hypothetical protein
MRSRTKAVGTKEILRQCLRSFHVSWMQITAVGWGSPRTSPLFIVHQHPIIVPVTGKFTFLPRRPPLTTVKSPKGRTRLLLGSAPAWAVCGSSGARFSPCERLVVSSAHLEDGTALTDKGLLLGKMAFGSFYYVRPGSQFPPAHCFGYMGKFHNGDLTKTLMLLGLCELCCAGTVQPNGADLRCRKRVRWTFGAEGIEGPDAPRVGCASAREWKRPGRGVPKDPTRPGRGRGLFRRRRCGALQYVVAANV